MRSPIRRLLGAAALGWLVTGCATSRAPRDAADFDAVSPALVLADEGDREAEPARTPSPRELLAEPLDADAAVRLALLGNRQLRAAIQELGISRGRVAQTGSLPNPTVEVARLAEPTHPLELRVEYDLGHALLAPLRADAAEPELDAARRRVAAEYVALSHRVRVAFHGAQAAEQRLGLAREVLEGLAASREAAEAMYAAGNVPELDVARRAAAHERARGMVDALELRASAERERLFPLLGLSAGEGSLRIQSGLPLPAGDLPDAEGLEARALHASLELAAMRSRLEGLSRSVDLSRAQGWLPELTVSISAQRESAGEHAAEASWGFGGGASVGLPLFDRRSGATTALEAELAALRERYQDQTLRLRASAREAHARVIAAERRERQVREVLLPAERRLREQTLLHYNAMQLGLYELLEARKQLLEAELAHVDALEAYWNAKAGLDAILAGHLVPLSPTEGPSTLAAEAADEGGH